MADPGNGKSAVTDPPDDRPEFPPRARTLTARTLTLEGPQRVDSAGLNISFRNGRGRRNLSVAAWTKRRSAIHPLRPISARYRMDRCRPIAVFANRIQLAVIVEIVGAAQASGERGLVLGSRGTLETLYGILRSHQPRAWSGEDE